ncbi:MAG: hypothetical protein ABUS79_11875 [Pseudomonadota bacterium]
MDRRIVGQLGVLAVGLFAGTARAQEATENVAESPRKPAESETPAASQSAAPAREPARAAVPEPSGWETTFYGFAELDAIRDSTQSYGPASNNAMLARPGTYAGFHPRTQLTANNSQMGVRVAAPAFGSSRVLGQAEIDFFGVQPSDVTEQNAYTAASIRMRLFTLKLETPIVDVLAGQYHDLFGWGGAGFYPNTVAFLGVPGQIYHRQPQIRLSKTVSGGGVRLDIAVAAVRPVQRDSETPDVQGGIKLAFDRWKGTSAQGFGQPTEAPVALGLSAVGRRMAVAEFLTIPTAPKVVLGWGAAANVFLPVIPAATRDRRGNSLSVTGEVSMGTGISDLYTQLTGGALFPMLPNPGSINPPPLYRPNIDSGIVTYDGNGNLKAINWRAFVVGGQYYLPIDSGRVWISATYSRLESTNIAALTPNASRGGIFTKLDYADGNLFFAVTPALQVALSYQTTHQVFGDAPSAGVGGGATAVASRNHRGEGALKFFF